MTTYIQVGEELGHMPTQRFAPFTLGRFVGSCAHQQPLTQTFFIYKRCDTLNRMGLDEVQHRVR